MLRLGSLRSESETWARLLKRLGPELLGVIDLEDPTASAAPAFWHRFGTHMAWQDLAPMVQLLCDLPEAVAALGGRIRVGFSRDSGRSRGRGTRREQPFTACFAGGGRRNHHKTSTFVAGGGERGAHATPGPGHLLLVAQQG